MICRKRLLVLLDFDLTKSIRPGPDALVILNPNEDHEQESNRSKRRIETTIPTTTTNQPRIGVLAVEPFVSGDGVFLSDGVGIQILLKQFRLQTKRENERIDRIRRSSVEPFGER